MFRWLPIFLLSLFLTESGFAARAILEKGKEKRAIDVRPTEIGPYIRLKDISDVFEFNFDWDGLRRKLTLRPGSHLVQMVEGRDWLYLDGKVHKLSGPLVVFQGYPELPRDFFELVIPQVFGRPFVLELAEVSEDKDINNDISDLEAFSLRKVETIVVDPGHGGPTDSGAFRKNVREKDITLLVGTIVKNRLKEQLPKVKVVLTRESDVPLSLKERNVLISGNKADLFLSIHVNSSSVESAQGIETYFLGIEATDKDAKRVAEFENQVFSADKTKETETRQWLRDLRQTEALSESSYLAEFVHESMIRKTGALDRGVKQAMFFVLMGSQIPAVLVELGFISNPKEFANFQSQEYMEKLADGISEGVSGFVKVHNEKIDKITQRKEKPHASKK